MTRPKVADEIFPLKELRVRGEIQNSLTLYQDNAAVIDKQMFALREAFGTFPFAVGGGKILLELWRASDTQDTSPKQLRWCIHLDGSAYNRIYITVPLVKAINKNNLNSKRIVHTLRRVAELPGYQKLLDFENKRVAINARGKANHRILQSLAEMQQGMALATLLPLAI